MRTILVRLMSAGAPGGFVEWIARWCWSLQVGGNPSKVGTWHQLSFCNNSIAPGQLTQHTFVLMVPEPDVQHQDVCVVGFWLGCSSWPTDGLFLVSSHGRGRDHLSPISSCKVTNPSHEDPPSWPNDLPRAPPPDAIPPVGRASTWEF